MRRQDGQKIPKPHEEFETLSEIFIPDFSSQSTNAASEVRAEVNLSHPGALETWFSNLPEFTLSPGPIWGAVTLEENR